MNATGKEEPAEAGYTGRGIILFFPNALRTNGFIGNCYVSQNYAKMENAGLPRGNIMFSQEQIDFGFKPGNIYVVSYTCAKEPGEVVQEAVSVTLEKMYPYADYAKVSIKEHGKILKAIQKHDKEAAQKTMYDHIMRSRDDMLTYYK